MIGTISTTLSALKSTVDLAKTAVAVRDDIKIAEATQLLNDRIIDVQNAALQLQEKLSVQRDDIETLKNDKRDLSAKIAELEQRKSERAQYQLKELAPGSFVLAYIEQGESSAPMHYLCQPCMDNLSQKAVLQQIASFGSYLLKCPSCKNEYTTGKTYDYGPLRFV